jgi:predicted RNA binding protein YcfA (HicA-like mRNA interferase family)
MPSKAFKLLSRARNSKAGWTSKDLLELYRGFGFSIREGRGSHVVVSHPDYPNNHALRAVVPTHAKELPKAYVVNAVKAVDELLALKGAINDDD